MLMKLLLSTLFFISFSVAHGADILDGKKFCGNNSKTNNKVCIDFNNGVAVNSETETRSSYHVQDVDGVTLVYFQGSVTKYVAYVFVVNWQYEIISVAFDFSDTDIPSGTKLTLDNPVGPCEQDPASC